MSEIEHKYSVVIPMYNAGCSIIKALKSIENQTRMSLIGEIIVVDDGSIDDSYCQVEAFSKETKLNVNLIHQNNSGVASARNAGINLAKYNWIALLDADDEWMPEKMSLQDDILINDKNIDLLGGEINDVPINLLYKKITKLTKIQTFDILIKVFPQTSTILFKKSLYDKIGGFSEELTHGEDVRFLVEACNNFNSYYHPQKIVIYDCGKKGFGVSGLSSNLKKMHDAHMMNLNYFYENNIIGRFFWCCLKFFYIIKYLRRIFKTRSKYNVFRKN